MMFPMSPTLKLYKAAPTQYLEYALAYAGPNSLKSKLKKRGLATQLSVQVDETSAATLVFLMFELTPKGAEEQGTQEIADSAFAYLRLVKDEPTPSVEKVYSAIKHMSQISFDYTEAPDSIMDAVSDLASSMSQYPPEDILTGSNGVVDQVNTTLVEQLLAAVADPTRMTMAVATKNFNTSTANEYEQYYGIHYRRAPMPKAWVQRWSQVPGEGLHAPPPLRFVPKALAVLDKDASNVPEKLEVNATTAKINTGLHNMELWWKGISHFAIPKAQMRVSLRLPKGTGADATQEALRRLHVELAGQVLEEPSEDMRNCGLDYQIQQSGEGYAFTHQGYSEHLDDLALATLKGFLHPQFNTQEFEHALQSTIDELADATAQMPYEHAQEAVSAITTDNVFSRTEVLIELRKINEAQLRNYIANVNKGAFHVKLLVVGNVDKTNAKSMALRIAQEITGNGQKLLEVAAARRSRVVQATKPVEIRMRNPIPDDANHATLNVYQYGVPDVSERVRLLLIGKMIENPVYDTLRTKKQLGYVVTGFMAQQVSVLELRVIVQGEKELPDLVDNDIEGVIKAFGTQLQHMPHSEFLRWKASLRSALNHPDQNMGQEADKYWAQIAADGHCFNRKEMALQYLETLESPAHVLETFERLRGQHRKVSVKLFGGKANYTKTSPSSLVMLMGDNTAQKHMLAEHATYYPSDGLCSVHK